MSEQDTLIPANSVLDENLRLVGFLRGTLDEGAKEVARLRDKLTYTYWIIVLLSIATFSLGILLLSVPALAAFRGEISAAKSIIAAGFGFADLAGIFLLRPIERIHDLMGDMGQIILAINSFQDQVALRLLQADLTKTNRNTAGEAAEHIRRAAATSIDLIQKYFESREGRAPAPTGDRPTPVQ